jgi:hypothetical protein
MSTLTKLILIFVSIIAIAVVRYATADTGAYEEGKVLFGSWFNIADDGSTLTFTFHPDGTMLWDIDNERFRENYAQGMTATYRLDRSVVPNTLDIRELGPTGSRNFHFRPTIEFQTDGSMLVEGYLTGGCPGADRIEYYYIMSKRAE